MQAGKNGKFEDKRARPYVARSGALLGVTVLGCGDRVGASLPPFKSKKKKECLQIRYMGMLERRLKKTKEN